MEKPSKQPNKTPLIIAAIAVLLIAVAWWIVPRMRKDQAPVNRQVVEQKRPKSNDPLQQAVDAYASGKYKEAEAKALGVVQANSGSREPAKQKKAVQARYLCAFSAARQKKMDVARERFAELRDEAAKLPDKGRPKPVPGSVEPSLEEEGAYQHAVCTAALGDKKAAEDEYMQFMRKYPESPLVHGAVKRIEKLHDGNLPDEAQELWQKAVDTEMKNRKAREKTAMLQASMCGPECLSELLRRKGKEADAKTLAKEMKTSEQGTTLLAMSEALNKRGLKAKGYQLSINGLQKQPLPLITLIRPGHYVVVESVSNEEVKVWDPSGKGIGKPSTQSYTMQQWQVMWTGMALVAGED